MALELHLPSIVGNISRSARAWAGISSEGGPRVSALGSVLLTLCAHRSGLVGEAAAGALGQLVEQATGDLECLGASVERLSRIHSGVIIALEQLDININSNSNDKLTHSLSAAEWRVLVEDVHKAMEGDLSDKRQVYAELKGAAHGRRGIDADNIELLAALWLEAPAMHAHVMQLPAAVLEAEQESARLAASLSIIHREDHEDARAPTNERKKNESLSPAMAMLLGK